MPTDTTQFENLQSRAREARRQDEGAYAFLLGCIMETNPEAVEHALTTWERARAREMSAPAGVPLTDQGTPLR